MRRERTEIEELKEYLFSM